MIRVSRVKAAGGGAGTLVDVAMYAPSGEVLLCDRCSVRGRSVDREAGRPAIWKTYMYLHGFVRFRKTMPAYLPRPHRFPQNGGKRCKGSVHYTAAASASSEKGESLPTILEPLYLRVKIYPKITGE